jgi:hypothetical protein
MTENGDLLENRIAERINGITIDEKLLMLWWQKLNLSSHWVRSIRKIFSHLAAILIM